MCKNGRPLAYYFPILNWLRQYKWSYLRGDLVAAVTMASIYIPMALSLAENLGHTPPINGLYSFVFTPLIYALLGSCPQLVVGPEAAGSLLVGTVIKTSIDRELSGEEDLIMHARIAGVITGMAGAVIFIAGLMRLGFLEGILSRPFMRGFISAIGFVIFADQLIPEMGLGARAKELHASHGSSVEKLVFLAKNISYAHGLTCAVAFGSFTIIMVLRYVLIPPPSYPTNLSASDKLRKRCSRDIQPWHISRIAFSSCFFPSFFPGDIDGKRMDFGFWGTSSQALDQHFLFVGLSSPPTCSTFGKQWGHRS